MLTMQSETKQCSDVIPILNQKEINVFVYHPLLLSPWLLIYSFMSNPQCLCAATNLWMSGENSQLMLLHVRGWCDINMRRCHSFPISLIDCKCQDREQGEERQNMMEVEKKRRWRCYLWSLIFISLLQINEKLLIRVLWSHCSLKWKQEDCDWRVL